MKRTASHNDLTLSPLRFLIVDDSDLNRKVIVRQIESERKGRLSKTYIRQADDGLTALEVMREELQEGRHFDVVLMDYTMINMHGPDAATVMRKEFKFRGPIIGKRVRGVVLRIRVTIMTLSIIVYMNTIAILRGYRQCPGGRHCGQ
mmetsp:Transcript_22647/g.32557  ORF Transcript_22647/g.32557 Transcript_22647/m.32557 type:complete len:147 (+) Transcript_22647:1364-1804(+)